MQTFPIDDLYKRVGKINLLRNDKKAVIGKGTGFFYRHSGSMYFATSRDSIIVEEKGFLPDTVVLYPNMEAKNFGAKNGITLSLYDQNERPTWRMLPSRESFVAIPIPSTELRGTFVKYFDSLERLPSRVHLPLGDVSLEFQISTAIAVANYFFYADSKSQKAIHMHIENQLGFNIDRKGFVKDMLEMTLRLMDCNLSDFAESNNTYETNLKTHKGLVLELEKIINQFSDVLVPHILARVRNIFELIKQKSFLEDYSIIRYLINKVLQQLGQNILLNS